MTMEPRRPWSLTVRLRKQIVTDYKGGVPLATIAFLYGVSPQYPSQIARDYGIPPRRPDLAAAKRRAVA